MGGATLTSVRTSSPTMSSPVVPPCTLVLLTACRRKSLAWLLPPSRSRSLLPPSVNTPYGSVAPSLLPSPPSRPCGSPRKSTTNLAPELSTANASKFSINFSESTYHSQKISILYLYLTLLNRIVVIYKENFLICV